MGSRIETTLACPFATRTALMGGVKSRFLLLPVLEQDHWLSLLASAGAASPRLREWVLGYLLVERDTRFDRHEFIRSLMLQAASTHSGPRTRVWSEFRRRIEAAIPG